MVNVGVIGCGYWGPKLIKNFVQIPNSHVLYVSSLDEDELKSIQKVYPSVLVTTDYRDIIEDGHVDAVVVATPVSSHYNLVKEALRKDKHVLVEKPMTCNSKDATELIAMAKANGKTLMVGHTFEYVEAVNKMREIVQSGELGEIRHIDTSRLNLGRYQQDINIIWDLAPHDISILIYVLGIEPISVSASGHCCMIDGIEDTSVIQLTFPNDILAVVRSSWVNPVKVRQTVVVGTKKMLVYDDVEPVEKVKIYDKGINVVKSGNNNNKLEFSYRDGNVTIPTLCSVEPLKTECSHFLECIEKDKTPKSDGEAGLKVVKVLEAAERSLRHGSRTELLV